MSNRELVIELINKLPEDTPLAEMAREIEFVAGIREGLAEADRGEGTPAEEVKRLVAEWATGSS